MIVSRNFVCLASKDGRVVLKPEDDAGAVNPRFWAERDRIVLEAEEGAQLFRIGDRYTIRIERQ